MKVVRLGDVCKVVSGSTPKRKIAEYWDGTIPWVTPKEISRLPSRFLWESAEKITEAGFRSCSTAILPVDSLLLSSRAPIGLLAINKIPVCTNQGFKSLIPGKDVHVEYLYYVLKANVSSLQAKGNGATFKELAKPAIENFEIPLPPFEDQIRIAHLLGKVEGLIALRKQHLQQLDDLLESVFLEMFGDPVRNEMGWDVVPFHKIGQFVSGGTPSKSREDYWRGDFPWVSPKDMKISKIADAEDHISESVFEETSLKSIAPGHLLIVVRGMILAHSFPLAINTVEIAINQDMKAIKPNEGINVDYLLHCLVSLKRQILKLISTAGHGTRKFDSIAMQRLFIPQPSELLQNEFGIIAEKIERIKSRYQQSLSDLETLYSALSQKAFKGELDLSRVPLPIDQAQVVDPVPTPEDCFA